MSSDRDHFGFHGNVHTCRTERTLRQAEERRDSTSVEFRPDGAIAHRMHRNPDGSSFASTYEYDDAGRLIVIRNNSNIGPAFLRLHKYDDAGRLIEVFAGSESGPKLLAETYRYDDSRRKTKTLHVQPSHIQSRHTLRRSPATCGVTLSRLRRTNT
jgi:hypothetical protein